MSNEYRIIRASQTEWIAGTVATPIAIKGYPTSVASRGVETIEMFEGAGDIGAMQRSYSKPGGRFRTAEVQSYLYGSATDDAPYIGALLRGCGFSENLGGTTPNIAYTYILASQHLLTDSDAGALDAVDLVLNTDLLKYTLDSAVGNVKLRYEPGRAPVATFSMRGLAETAAVGAALATFVPGAVPVAWQNAAITIEVAAGGAITDLVYGFIEVDTANKIDPRKDGNGVYSYSAPRLAGRMPTCEFQVESGLLATLDVYGAQAAGSLIELKWSHDAGGGMGKTIKHGFRGYIAAITPVDVEGKLCFNVMLEQSGVVASGFWIGWVSTAEYSYPF